VMQPNKSYSLAELVFQVKALLNQTFAQSIWIVAEIGELNTNYSGHCYLEHIEKEESTERILAKCRATIWASAFRMIKPYFETTTRETLRAGLKVLLKVSVEFHEFYGFSLNVVDIDPSYTVGEMAMKRLLIIEKLKTEGVYDMNKGLELPLVAQHIAVISSETAAGYGDFIQQLQNNAWGIAFNTQLFPAIMQGDKAAGSIIEAFYQVFEHLDDFDAVVLIRGGGSKTDLSCFDDYELAYTITQFPLPVITGIGHDRDESIADMVAHTALKTPTAVAEFLIDKADAMANWLAQAYQQMVSLYNEAIQNEMLYLNDSSSRLIHQVRHVMQLQENQLKNSDKRLTTGVQQYFKSQQSQLQNHKINLAAMSKSTLKQTAVLCQNYHTHLVKWGQNRMHQEQKKLDFAQSKLNLIDPQNVLKRGYAIVTNNGKAITDSDQVQQGEMVNIHLQKGKLSAQIKDKST